MQKPILKMNVCQTKPQTTKTFQEKKEIEVRQKEDDGDRDIYLPRSVLRFSYPREGSRLYV